MSSALHEPVTRDTAPLPRRRRRWPGRGALAAGAVGLVALFGATWSFTDLLPDLDNPFRQETVDRSSAPLMLAISDLAEYHAAAGTFQVVVDIERDTPYVPSIISGERTTFLATGTVDAVVDFTEVGAERVEVSADRTAVAFSLPAPVLEEAVVDPEQSRVVDRDRGLLDRAGDALAEVPAAEEELYVLAGDRIDESAGQSDLRARAEENTRGMLTTLARSLGFTSVTVTFDAPAPGAAG